MNEYSKRFKKLKVSVTVVFMLSLLSHLLGYDALSFLVTIMLFVLVLKIWKKEV